MDCFEDVLRYDEQVIYRLRSLYSRFGYAQYRMSRFEEYGLYAENKAFLASGNIITFTGAGGKLMALRPDVTLSIVKSTLDDSGLKKLCYNENVYRPDGPEFKEKMQVGLECIGDIDIDLMGEVLMLARRSLGTLGDRVRLDISHMGIIGGLLQSVELSPEQRAELLQSLSEKNLSALNSLCAAYGVDDGLRESLAALLTLYGSIRETIGALRKICVNDDTKAALEELENVFAVLHRLGAEDDVSLDFSIVNDLNYYSGIIFQGYVRGIPKKVLSGGRYDELLRRFGKKSGAIGFAVYLDLLELYDDKYRHLDDNTSESTAKTPAPDHMVNIALPKGRLGENAYAIFEASGYGCPEIHEESRRLVFENVESGIRYFWVKPSDVAIYVEHGAADIGVAGKDTLLEYSPDVYELLDLGIGKCSICVAAEKGYISSDSRDRTLRVATKFSNIARDYYGKLGREIDIIRLNGSIELAPLLGLSDVIVDIVETGKTLEENNLEPVEHIMDISARLVANKVSYKFKHEAIRKLCDRIAQLGIRD